MALLRPAEKFRTGKQTLDYNSAAPRKQCGPELAIGSPSGLSSAKACFTILPMKLLPFALMLCLLVPASANAGLALLAQARPAAGEQQSAPAAPAPQPAAQPAGAAGVPRQTTVKVAELPPLNMSKDWTDRSYWVFTLFLAIVGALQAYLLWGTMRVFERQAAQMEHQTGILQQSVGLAEKSADAARQNLELFMSRERAHLRIELTPLQMPLHPGIPELSYRVTLHGASEAYVSASCFRAELTDSPEPGDDAHWFPAMAIPQVITTDERKVQVQVRGIYPKLELEQSDIDAIEAGRRFIHVRGFIKYTDVFGTERWTRFRRMWELSPRHADGTRDGHWSRRGSPKDNSDT